MNQFAIELLPPNEWGARMALVRVDGRPLLDLIREVETPIATAAGQPQLAGAYDYLNSASVIFPSRHLLGEAADSLLAYGDKVSVLECECGCPGCWPLLIRITVTDNMVVWSDFQQPHRENWIILQTWYWSLIVVSTSRHLRFPRNAALELAANSFRLIVTTWLPRRQRQLNAGSWTNIDH